MGRFFTGLVLAVAVFVGLSFSAPREAAALTCMSRTSGFPSTCLIWGPDAPPGGRYCTGAPGADEINIYTAPGRGGFCATIPAHMGWWNFTSTNGWYAYFYVKDIWVGSSAGGGYVCTGENGGGSCPALWAGYDFSYNNPPYGATQPGWRSIVLP